MGSFPITVTNDKNQVENITCKINEKEFQCSPSKPPSCTSSPAKYANDEDDDDDNNVSSASSTNSLTLCQNNNNIPRRHHSKRLSVDNLMLSPSSPTLSVSFFIEYYYYIKIFTKLILEGFSIKKQI